jgi:hypothetical protein
MPRSTAVLFIALFILIPISQANHLSPIQSIHYTASADQPSTATFYLNLTAPYNPETSGGFCGQQAKSDSSDGWQLYPLSPASPQLPGSNSVDLNFLYTCGSGSGPATPFMVSSVEIRLWGFPSASPGTIGVILTDVSPPEGYQNIAYYYPTNHSDACFVGSNGCVSAASTCANAGLLDFFVPSQYIGSYPLNSSDVFKGEFDFNDTVPPTICSGPPGQPSEVIVQGSRAIVTPEFPLGTVISILVPMSAIVLYALSSNLRRGKK